MSDVDVRGPLWTYIGARHFYDLGLLAQVCCVLQHNSSSCRVQLSLHQRRCRFKTMAASTLTCQAIAGFNLGAKKAAKPTYPAPTGVPLHQQVSWTRPQTTTYAASR